jgi:hypothetical protein
MSLIHCEHVRERRPRRATAAGLVLTLLSATSHPSRADSPEIVTWVANEPTWNQLLGVTLLRQGCSATPDECLERIRASSRAQRIDRFALAVKRDAGKWPVEALEYSRRSLVEPLLVEVDIDDFASTLKRWDTGTRGQGNRILAEITQNLKRHNPRLRFGVTLYEDELDSPFIAWIPLETRARVDRVSLFLHYRANSVNFAKYVAQAKELFPRAAIWAGSYAYDRIDYLPCASKGSRPCAAIEEIGLFRDSLRLQLDMLRAGSIAGIEFYPGFFGREAAWYGWNNPRICRPERRRECVENTRQMRALVAEEFARFSAGPAAGEATVP